MKPVSDVSIHLRDGDGMALQDPFWSTDHWCVAIGVVDHCSIYSRSPAALRCLAAAATEAADKLEQAIKSREGES